MPILAGNLQSITLAALLWHMPRIKHDARFGDDGVPLDHDLCGARVHSDIGRSRHIGVEAHHAIDALATDGPGDYEPVKHTCKIELLKH